MIKAFSQIKVINQKLRQLGSAALELCYVANGRVDAFFMTGMNPWDVAAGTVILREAGGMVTDFQGKEFDMNSTIYSDLTARFIKGSFKYSRKSS
jgi:myo-inositol-1(or 4)-monophosphatase